MAIKLWCGVVTLAIAAAAAAVGPSNAADSSEARHLVEQRAFLGLWEGIDPLDGSTVQASITNTDRNGLLEMVQTESFFTNCFKLGPNYSEGRGVITGRGRVVNKRVRGAGGPAVLRSVYSGQSSFVCISNDGVPGTPSVATFEYPLQQNGQILLLPGAPFNTPDIVLHRMAS